MECRAEATGLTFFRNGKYVAISLDLTVSIKQALYSTTLEALSIIKQHQNQKFLKRKKLLHQLRFRNRRMFLLKGKLSKSRPKIKWSPLLRKMYHLLQDQHYNPLKEKLFLHLQLKS
jgi:hypothetical protein